MKFRYLPNLISFSRIIISPIFIYMMLKNTFYFKFFSMLIFFLGSLSDALDGYIARKFNIKTDLGKYIDPLADKILIISGFCIFSYYYPHIIKVWMIVIIVLRDILTMTLRNFMINKNSVLITSKFAKGKTFFQILVMHILLLLHIYNPAYINNYNFSYFLMLLCVFFSIASTFHYIMINFLLKK